MNILYTTTEHIEGKEISEMLGVVRGNSIRAKHLGKDIIVLVRMLFGGEIKEYVEAMNEARDVAIERMLAEAKEMEADAVVCVRFTTSQVMTGAAELMVYGTAVKLK